MGTSGLGALLVEEGLLTEADRRTIKRTCGSHGPAFARSIIALGLLDEDELAAFLAEKTQWRVAAKELTQETQKEAWGTIDRPLIERLEVLPLKLVGQTLHVAMVDPLDQDTIKQLAFFTGFRIHPVISTLTQIREGLKKLLRNYQPASSQLEDFLTNHAVTAGRRLRLLEGGRPAKKAPRPVVAEAAAVDELPDEPAPRPTPTPRQQVVAALQQAEARGEPEEGDDGSLLDGAEPDLEYPDSVNAAESGGEALGDDLDADLGADLGGDLEGELGGETKAAAPAASAAVAVADEDPVGMEDGDDGADAGGAEAKAIDLGGADLESMVDLNDFDPDNPDAGMKDLGGDLDGDLGLGGDEAGGAAEGGDALAGLDDLPSGGGDELGGLDGLGDTAAGGDELGALEGLEDEPAPKAAPKAAAAKPALKLVSNGPKSEDDLLGDLGLGDDLAAGLGDDVDLGGDASPTVAAGDGLGDDLDLGDLGGETPAAKAADAGLGDDLDLGDLGSEAPAAKAAADDGLGGDLDLGDLGGEASTASADDALGGDLDLGDLGEETPAAKASSTDDALGDDLDLDLGGETPTAAAPTSDDALGDLGGDLDLGDLGEETPAATAASDDDTLGDLDGDLDLGDLGGETPAAAAAASDDALGDLGGDLDLGDLDGEAPAANTPAASDDDLALGDDLDLDLGSETPTAEAAPAAESGDLDLGDLDLGDLGDSPTPSPAPTEAPAEDALDLDADLSALSEDAAPVATSEAAPDELDADLSALPDDGSLGEATTGFESALEDDPLTADLSAEPEPPAPKTPAAKPAAKPTPPTTDEDLFAGLDDTGLEDGTPLVELPSGADAAGPSFAAEAPLQDTPDDIDFGDLSPSDDPLAGTRQPSEVLGTPDTAPDTAPATAAESEDPFAADTEDPLAAAGTLPDAASFEHAALLNRALLSITLAADVHDGVRKAAGPLGEAGLSRGIVVALEKGVPRPVSGWETGTSGTQARKDGLAPFVTTGLNVALARLYAGWAPFGDGVRPENLRPFQRWLDKDHQLMAAALPLSGGRQLAVITAWHRTTRDDGMVRQAALEVFRKLAQKKC